MKIKNSKKVYVLTVLVFILVGFLHSETQPQQPLNYSDPDAGTEANPYLISNLANLRWLSEVSDDWWKGENIPVHFLQTAEIDAYETRNWNSGEGFKPIGHDGLFVGVYNGDRYVISNLFISQSSISNAVNIGLFGRILNSEIKNVYLESSELNYLSGGNAGYVGGIVGFSELSSISNCYSIVTALHSASNSAFSGGIAGRIQDSSIINSFSIGNVSATGLSSFAGGIVGYAEGVTSSSQILNSYSIGNISSSAGTFTDAGGIVGTLINSSISCSYSVGNVSASSSFNIPYVGGLVGYSENSSVSMSFWDIETTGVIVAVGESTSGSTIIDCYGRTTEEMKQLETYTEYGWDFVNVWEIDFEANDGYPYLQSTYPLIENILPPINLKGIVLDFIVTLTWDDPESSQLGYKVYRNNLLVSDELITETTFVDSDVSIGLHLYSVIAVYKTGISEPTTIEIEIAEVEELLSPINLLAVVDEHTVTLTWQAPENNPEGYYVYRGDTLLENFPITDTTFSEFDVPVGVHTYNVFTVYQTGISEPSAIEIEVKIVSDHDDNGIFLKTKLVGNYPNPFNPNTTIRYDVAQAGNVVIDIYNVRGQKIATLLNSHKEAGEHTAVWHGLDGSGREVSSGIYLAIMRMDDFTQIRRMTLLK